MSNRITLAIALVCMSGIGGLAVAQSVPPEAQPQPGAPSETQPQQTPPADTGATVTSADKRTQLKECLAQQKEQQSATGMSSKDMKKYCKEQIKNAPESQTPK
jgi:hypothetical protein